MSAGPEELQDLRRLVADYLTVRRALGFKLDNAEYILGRFLSFLEDREALPAHSSGHSSGRNSGHGVTVAHALEFATAPPAASPRTQALRLSAIRCFARWAACQDPAVEVPPSRLLPARATRVAPFIYTGEQIGAMLEAAGTLKPELRAATFGTLIGLMATTGIRTGEAIGLDVASLDQDAGTLRVTGKYGKVRMLPLHPTVTAALTGYLKQRDRLLPAAACPALLISTHGNRLPPSTVHATFRGLTRQAGLRPASSSCRPRLHDLRHTFAVSTMLEAYRSGEDPAVVLPVLSTWLGHTEPRDTYWYLSGTAELLAAAIERLDGGGQDERSRP